MTKLKRLMGYALGGACEPAIDGLHEEPRTVDEVISRHAAWLLSNRLDQLTPEQVDACARRDPWAAVEYAADKLTPERLDECARQHPLTALRNAADKLTPERLDWCARRSPGTALKYAEVALVIVLILQVIVIAM